MPNNGRLLIQTFKASSVEPLLDASPNRKPAIGTGKISVNNNINVHINSTITRQCLSHKSLGDALWARSSSIQGWLDLGRKKER
jgi:hypothetical protein